jgi:hypothetical protein
MTLVWERGEHRLTIHRWHTTQAQEKYHVLREERSP